MPNELKNLAIEEVSLVDNPANSSIDPRTGRKIQHATVAIWKRDGSRPKPKKFKDDPGTQDVDGSQEKKTMKLKHILKSANVTRAQICEAIERKAVKIAKREGIDYGRALALAWDDNPGAVLKYEAAPVTTSPRPQTEMAEITKAEFEIDKRARNLMKKDAKLSYAKACTQVLYEDPALYQKYETELAGSQTLVVPSPRSGEPFLKSDDEDGGECPSCHAGIDDGDKFCPSCGKRIPAAKK